MESIDALRQHWQAHDARLDQVVALNRRILQALESGGTRTALQRVGRTLWAQAAVDLIAVLMLGSFLGNHARALLDGATGEWRFLLPALALFLPAVALLASVIGNLVQFHAIDVAGPVIQMQRRLEQLRRRRTVIAKTVILTAPALWVAILIVALRGFFAIDVYAWLPAWWFWLNVAVGLLLIPAALWASRRYFDRLSHLPLTQWLVRDLAGTGFHEAHEQLARLAAFERENGGSA